MWNSGRGQEEEGKEDPETRSRLVASALAAYAGGNVDPNYRYADAAAFPAAAAAAQYAQATNPLLYQSQAVEAMRQQEELQLRQQALYSLQQQQALQQQQELQELEYARQLQQQQRVLAAEQQSREALVAAELAAEQQSREALAVQQLEEMARLKVDRSFQPDESARLEGAGHPTVKETQQGEDVPVPETTRESVVDEGDKKPPAKKKEAKKHATQECKISTAEPMDSNDSRDPTTPPSSSKQATEERKLSTPEPMDVDPVDSDASPRVLTTPARGKPEAMATAIAAARIRKEMEEEEEAVATAVPVADDAVVEVQAQAEVAATPLVEKVSPKKATLKRKRTPSKPRKKKPSMSGPTLDDPVPPITDVDYENVVAMMEQFCRVPLLAEFSRPVSLLHPELFPKYSKIVTHPIDLGQICRRIRRRKYKNTRNIQLDMWRIFANCIKYHTSPSNKENSVPSFVSIALHLREYFNALWQEYMLPSDPPAAASTKSPSKSDSMFSKREKDRKSRLATSAATVLSVRCLEKVSSSIRRFIEMEGRVDKLDNDGIFGDDDADDDGDMDEVVENLQKLQRRIGTMAQDEADYSVDELDADIRRCYTGDLFENKPSLRIRVGHRLDRLLGKTIVNIYEANSRGVNQSSIWGCMAAAVWARESSKKPFWPALVLGIMAPDEQKEEWHTALTTRNERRLPEKLLSELQTGRRKAEHAIRRQNDGKAEQMSYFLVEFMGTHEFIWVKESDMIETFDPDVDPNQSIAAGNVTKKKRSSRSNDVLGSKTFADALEEGRWALEEFELQLNDTCGDLAEQEEEDEEANYSYAVLCQSDDEADSENAARDSDAEDELTMSEIEEANELLSTDGLLDFSVAGRKNAKKRAAALKKQKADAEKAALKKEKSDRAKKAKGKAHSKKSPSRTKGTKRERENEEKREQRELERRRKKRARERERVLKEETRKKKKSKTSMGDSGGKKSTGKRNAIADKSGRASSIVKAYLMNVAKKEDLKSLGLAGVMAVPAAQLDSTGLLGMALAFRAAAGELNMPESSDSTSKTKAWEAVDVDGPLTTKEREENLSRRKALLEAEIERIKAATRKRKELTEAAVSERYWMEEEVAANDKAARRTLMKKKKKTVKAEPKTDVAETSPKKESDEMQEKTVDAGLKPKAEGEEIDSTNLDAQPAGLAVGEQQEAKPDVIEVVKAEEEVEEAQVVEDEVGAKVEAVTAEVVS